MLDSWAKIQLQTCMNNINVILCIQERGGSGELLWEAMDINFTCNYTLLFRITIERMLEGNL